MCTYCKFSKTIARPTKKFLCAVSVCLINVGSCQANTSQSRCLLNMLTKGCPKDVMTNLAHSVSEDCYIDCCTDNSCVGKHLGGVYSYITGSTGFPPDFATTTITTAPNTVTTTPVPTTATTTAATTVAPYNVYAHVVQECRVRSLSEKKKFICFVLFSSLLFLKIGSI